jgi:hypothetical protein
LSFFSPFELTFESLDSEVGKVSVALKIALLAE